MKTRNAYLNSLQSHPPSFHPVLEMKDCYFKDTGMSDFVRLCEKWSLEYALQSLSGDTCDRTCTCWHTCKTFYTSEKTLVQTMVTNKLSHVQKNIFLKCEDCYFC